MATESFFSSASLAYLASAGAGKDGKAYSIKPTDGTGDFTFSRGSNLAATRVGPTGLIEKGRENLLLQSNSFDTTWATSSASVTSGQSGYDGSSDAWEIGRDGAAGLAFIYQNISATGVQTFSLYAKANTEDWIYLQDTATGGGAGYFDLANGTAGTTSGIDSSIDSVGNGWYRIQIVFNRTTSGNIRIFVASANASLTVTGSIYIQDAQMEIGLAATDYIESGATTGKAGLLEDEPRFDYSGGATCPSLLLEPSRTQLLPYTEYFDGYSNTGSTDEPNAATSPEGLTNATFLKEDTSTGSHILIETTAATAGVYTASVFAKANGRDWLFLNIAPAANYGANFNLSNGTTGTIQSNITSATIEDYGNGWYRCSITADTTTSAISPRIAMYLATADSTLTYTGDGTSGIYIWGAQLEAGSYPTSYIPNHSGGTITRGADVCGDAGDVNTFNSTEGVLYLEASAIDNGSSEKGLALNDGSTNNRINIRIVNNDIKAYGIVGGSLVCLMTYTDPSVTGINKIAFKYKENDFALWVNGVERVTDNSGSIFPANTLNELSFDYGGASAFFYGNVKQVLTFNTALSDADLTTLTT